MANEPGGLFERAWDARRGGAFDSHALWGAHVPVHPYVRACLYVQIVLKCKRAYAIESVYS
jgi:hypothetical protein